MYILEYFSCFWKVFCFENFQKKKNSKIFNPAFWQLTYESQVFKAQAPSLPKVVRDSLTSRRSRYGKHLEIFSKSRF